MNENMRQVLWDQYGHLLEIAEKTVEKLGKEKAWQFVELANDWIDLNAAIMDRYPKDELFTSLVYADFNGLFKELRWLQLLLLGGGYPVLYRNLRFVWEWVFRAHYVDRYAHENPSAPDPPGPSVDDKIAWLEQRERQLNWKNVIEPTLQVILPTSEHTQIEVQYQPMWQKLNQCVHPSSALRYRLIDESGLLVRDSFDEAWANEAIEAAVVIFDLLWVAVLSRFPNSLPLLTGPYVFSVCPMARTLVEGTATPFVIRCDHA